MSKLTEKVGKTRAKAASEAFEEVIYQAREAVKHKIGAPLDNIELIATLQKLRSALRRLDAEGM